LSKASQTKLNDSLVLRELSISGLCSRAKVAGALFQKLHLTASEIYSYTAISLFHQSQLSGLQDRRNALIAQITGKLLQKQPNSVIVDVGGVGYELIVPVSTFYDLGEPGADVSLRVYTYVREDALQLYGFRTDQEKKLFLQLTSVNGIGPKLAVTILSGMSADELIPAIRGNDLARLTSIPGIGKKTAERMVVELRDKLSALSDAETQQQIQSGMALMSPDAIRDDIVSALVNLGYQKAAAEKAVAAVLKEMPDAKFEQILKNSLRRLAR
jgi:Holliday junction DNA helicase RuvA